MCTESTAVVIETSEICFHELQLDSFQGAWFPFNIGLLISSAIYSSFVWNNSASVAIFEVFCKWQEFSWKRPFTAEKRTYPWEDGFYSGRSIYSQPIASLHGRKMWRNIVFLFSKIIAKQQRLSIHSAKTFISYPGFNRILLFKTDEGAYSSWLWETLK